ncbi:MAG: RHS repeat domain-containing protein [Anaerolineae bacterium]
MRQGDVVYYVHQDHLGSTVAVSDEDGQAVGRVQYDPYGEIITSTLPVALTDRLFTGQRWHGTIGLYQMGARWYDPALGRWLQADTIVPEPGNPQALNRYSYVLGNPLRYADPSGHYIFEGPYSLSPWHPAYVPSADTFYVRAIGRIPVRADTYLLSPAESEAIFGVAVAQRVSAGTVVAVNDPNKVGMLYVTLAAALTGWAANLPMPQFGPRMHAPASLYKDIIGDPGFGPELGSHRAASQLAGGAGGASAPKRYGRLGGPEHRAAVRQIIEDLEFQELGWRTEFKVNTPGGAKPYRFVDVAALDADGNPTAFYQVGRITKGGLPMARERYAISDIYEFGGYDVPIHFVPYYK